LTYSIKGLVEGLRYLLGFQVLGSHMSPGEESQQKVGQMSLETVNETFISIPVSKDRLLAFCDETVVDKSN
jgi:hypothetical protein